MVPSRVAMIVYSPNPEYPDLPFAIPRSYGSGRSGRGWGPPLPRLIVIHHTAGQEHAQAAEDGAAYDQRREDGTSAHYYVDPNSIVQCVATWDRANTAFRNGNTLGIQYELCGTLQSREQWLDSNSRQILKRAAAQIARDMLKYNIPLVRLNPSQVAAGKMGVCGHVDITYAFPADGGTHTDPGPNFPWDVLFDDIKKAMASIAMEGVDNMKMVIVQDADGSLWLSNLITRRRIKDNADLAHIQMQGLPGNWWEDLVWPGSGNVWILDIKNLADGKGNRLDDWGVEVGGPVDVEVSDEQIAEIADAAREGAASGSGDLSEESLDAIETRVDQQLDQQSRGGADDDLQS